MAIELNRIVSTPMAQTLMKRAAIFEAEALR